MANDMVAVDWQSIVHAEVCKEHDKAFDLLICRLADLKIPAHMDANGVTVVPVRVRSDRPMRAPKLHCAVLADDVVVADARPALRLMRGVNLRRREVIIRWIARVMDDDLIGYVACSQVVMIDVKIVILSRTVDKFLTREQTLKKLYQRNHRTDDASSPVEARRLPNKFGGCSNRS